MVKIGRSSISVNVATPYTRVGHCDNARWMSVDVLVSLVGNELAQSFKRIIAFWTNMRSFWCQVFLLISLRRNQSQRTSQTTRWRDILTARYAVRMPFISRMPKSCLSPLSRNHYPTAPPPRSRKTSAIVKHSKTIHVFLPLPSPST